MNFNFIFATFVAALAQTATASQLRCQYSSGDLYINPAEKTVVVTDDNSPAQLSLEVLDFQTFRCPLCYAIKVRGSAVDNSATTINLTTIGVSGSFNRATLKIEATRDVDGAVVAKEENIPCDLNP